MSEHNDRSADSTELERSIEQLLFNKVMSNRVTGFTVTVAHEIMGLVHRIGIPGAAQPTPAWRAVISFALRSARVYIGNDDNPRSRRVLQTIKTAVEALEGRDASQPSPAATVETLNEQAREHPRYDNPRDPFASPDRLLPSSSAASEPVAYRWRQPGNKHWIYDPTPEWVQDHKHEIELEALYRAVPQTASWQPIKTAPSVEWGKSVDALVYSPHLGIKSGTIGNNSGYIFASVSSYNGNAVENWGVTHWMPLPSCPLTRPEHS